jgi:hypothetical protein
MEWLEDMRVISCQRSHNIEKAKKSKVKQKPEEAESDAAQFRTQFTVLNMNAVRVNIQERPEYTVTV